MGILHLQPLSIKVLRDSTLYSRFMSSDLSSANKWSLLPSRKDFGEFTGLENLNKDSLLPNNLWCLTEKSSVGKRFLIRPVFAWRKRDGSPRSYRILRWTGHQVFSCRVINLWSFRICFWLLLVQWWSQQSTNLLIVQVRVWRRCHDALSRIASRRYARSAEE